MLLSLSIMMPDGLSDNYSKYKTVYQHFTRQYVEYDGAPAVRDIYCVSEGR